MAFGSDEWPLTMDIPRQGMLLGVAAGGLIVSTPSGARRISTGSTPEAAPDSMDRATFASDRETLERLIAPDFVWVGGSSPRTDKHALPRNIPTSEVMDRNVPLPDI
jgi:hypothetical protein